MIARRKRLGFLPGWRLFSYVIIVFNLIMLIWVIAGAVSGSHANNCASQTGDAFQTAQQAQQLCRAATNTGTAIGVGIVIALWVAGDVILGILWLITRPRGRTCPACGTNAKKGVTVCRGCGYNFAQAAGMDVASAP
jgi:rubredoxin